MRPTKFDVVPLGDLLEDTPQNGYSPVCQDSPTGKWVLGLSALDGRGLDLSEPKPAPANDPLVDKFMLRPGDFLISRSNTFDKVGRVGVFQGGLENCSYPDLMMRFRPDSSKVNPGYLETYLKSDRVIKFIRQHATGTSGSMKKINQAAVESIPVIIPPLMEQKTIAAAVGTWYGAIQKIERLIAAKEQHFSALLCRLITSRTNSESWRQVPIREVAERIQRQSGGGKYPLLTIASASGFMLQEEKYGRYMAGESAKTYTLLRAGEFSYNKGNSKRYEFGCVFQLQDHEAALVPSVYVSFKLHESVCAAYLRHLFAADYLKPQLRALVKTGVRNNGLLNIRPDEFMGTTVPLPTFQEQKRIADVLDAARQEIALLLQQVEALKTQKRGLMQKLLTGQWRVPIHQEATV